MAERVFLAEETLVILNIWSLVLGVGRVGRKLVRPGWDSDREVERRLQIRNTLIFLPPAPCTNH